MDALDTQTQTGTLKHVRSLQWVTVIKSQQEFDTELEAAKRRLAGDVQTLNLLNEPICERLRNKSRARGHQLSYVAVRGSATLLHAGHSRKKKEKKEALRFVIFPALCPRSLPPPSRVPNTPLAPTTTASLAPSDTPVAHVSHHTATRCWSERSGWGTTRLTHRFPQRNRRCAILNTHSERNGQRCEKSSFQDTSRL